MPQDANIFGNTVAARCFESQILKASRNPMLRGHWQLSRKWSSKIKLLGALPLRVLFCPVWGERRGHIKDSYAKGRLKLNAYFDIFYTPYGRTQGYCWGNLWDPRDNFRMFPDEYVGLEYWGWIYEPKDMILACPQATVLNAKQEFCYLAAEVPVKLWMNELQLSNT